MRVCGGVKGAWRVGVGELGDATMVIGGDVVILILLRFDCDRFQRDPRRVCAVRAHVSVSVRGI